MRVLGSIQNVSQGAYVNKATPRKVAQDKGGGNRQPRQNAAAAITKVSAPEEAAASIKAMFALTADSVDNTAAGTLVGEPKIGLLKSLVESISEAGSEVERGRGSANPLSGQSAATSGKIDLSFGVEEMTYKNMWKVLKTVVREIGDFRKASSGRFFLGVSERLEKAPTLMQFDSIVDYLDGENIFGQNAVSSEATDGEAGRIVADPAAFLQAQANIVPDRALQLLGGTG